MNELEAIENEVRLIDLMEEHDLGNPNEAQEDIEIELDPKRMAVVIEALKVYRQHHEDKAGNDVLADQAQTALTNISLQRD